MSGDLSTLVGGVQAHLAAVSELTALLGATGPDAWVFRQFPQQLIETTEQAAVVIGYRQGWNASDTHLMSFPALELEIYVDPQRDPGGNVQDYTEAVDRGLAIFAVVDRNLRVPPGSMVTWGDVRVSVCSRQFEPVASWPAEGDGLARLASRYSLVTG